MFVSKLFDICLEYVARKISLVESFVGFPDTVGQKIFHAVQTTGQLELKDPAVSHQILSLFTSAYTDILTDVNIEGEHLLLADCLDHLILFSHLRTMNVSSCCLGDKHELLFHISTLKSLKVLVLRNNDLTDEGIRKLTAPIRIKKTGPLQLNTLDLSENREVTIKSVKFLRVFSALQLLNLSSTAIHDLHCKQNIPELQEYARGRSLLVMTAVSEELGASVRGMLEVRTEGWAASVIHTWVQQSHQRCQTAVSAHSEARQFYGRNKSKVQVNPPPAVPSSSKKGRESSRLSLVLIHTTLVSGCPSMSTPQSEVCSSGSLIITSQQSQISVSGSLSSKTPLSQVTLSSRTPLSQATLSSSLPSRTPLSQITLSSSLPSRAPVSPVRSGSQPVTTQGRSFSSHPMTTQQPELRSSSSLPVKTPVSWTTLSSSVPAKMPLSQATLSSSVPAKMPLPQANLSSSLPVNRQQSQASSPCKICHKESWQQLCPGHPTASSGSGRIQTSGKCQHSATDSFTQSTVITDGVSSTSSGFCSYTSSAQHLGQLMKTSRQESSDVTLHGESNFSRSCSHTSSVTKHPGQYIDLSRQEFSGVKEQGEREWDYVGKNDRLDPHMRMQRTSVSSVKSDHAELHTADSDAVHRWESSSSLDVPSRKRGRECCSGQCDQQKKMCRERDLSDDELMLLCQYGYSDS